MPVCYVCLIGLCRAAALAANALHRTRSLRCGRHFARQLLYAAFEAVRQHQFLPERHTGKMQISESISLADY